MDYFIAGNQRKTEHKHTIYLDNYIEYKTGVMIPTLFPSLTNMCTALT